MTVDKEQVDWQLRYIECTLTFTRFQSYIVPNAEQTVFGGKEVLSTWTSSTCFGDWTPGGQQLTSEWCVAPAYVESIVGKCMSKPLISR